MKYKVGDKVIIQPLHIFKDFPSRNPNGLMDHWAGKVMTIKRVDGGYYEMYEDEGERFRSSREGWRWADCMIAGLYSPYIDKKVILDFIKE